MVQLGKKAADGNDIHTRDGQYGMFVHTDLQGLARRAKHANGLCMHAGCSKEYYTKIVQTTFDWQQGLDLDSRRGHAQNLYKQINI